MSHYYLADPVKPYRFAGNRPTGWDSAPRRDRNWWCVRPADHRFILWTRDALALPGLTLFANDEEEVLGEVGRKNLEGLFGDREFPPGCTLAEALGDIYMRPPAGRKAPVSDMDQKFRLMLGPGAREPVPRPIFQRDDPVKRSHSVAFSDNFNSGTNINGRTFSGGTATWTEGLGTLWAVSGGRATLTDMATGFVEYYAYTSHDTDSSDFYVGCDLATFARASGTYLQFTLYGPVNGASRNRLVRVSCAQDNSSSQTFINEMEGGTDIDMDTDTLVTTGTWLLEISGSTVTFKFNGSTYLTGTLSIGPAGTGERRAGIYGIADGGSTNDIAIDNFIYGDLVTTVSGSANITLGALTSTATGAVRVAGSLNSTLGALTTDATGTVRVAGSLDATLGALTVDATGEVGAAISGSADITLGGLVVTATGQVVVTGSVDAVLGALTAESSGETLRGRPIRRRKKYIYLPPQELTAAEVKQLYREARQEIPVRVQGGLLTLAPDLFRNRSERELPALSRLSITKLRQEIDLLRSLQAELADIERAKALKAEQDYQAALRRPVKKDFDEEEEAIIFAISELGQ